MRTLLRFLMAPVMLLLEGAGGGAGGTQTPEGGGAGSQGQISPEVLKAAGIETTADGLVYQIDPNDPNSTVYKGRDYAELMNNVRNGISAKDRYISELRASNEDLEPPPGGQQPPAGNQSTDEKVLLDAAAQRFGIEREMFDYTPDQWRDYERVNGSVNASRLAVKVDAIKQQVLNQVESAREASQTVAINTDIVRRETNKVRELLREYGIPEEKFEAPFDKILDEIFADDNSYIGGVLDTGLIVQKSAAAMKSLLTTTEQTRLQQELAQQRESLSRAAAGGGGAGPSAGAPGPAPKDYDEAIEMAKSRLRQKG